MENKKLNIAELLKDCPKGMELDCTIYDDITLFGVDDPKNTLFPIKVLRSDGCKIHLTEYGQYADADFAKCVIFPKGKTTWEGFVPPCEFKDGDILKSCNGNPFIFKQINSFDNAECYCAINCFGELIFNSDNWASIKGCRLATEEEKTKLFDAIKDNGYKWNPEIKTLGKLPKFKVGDKIIKKNGLHVPFVITGVSDDYYRSNTGNSVEVLPIEDQDDWELVPNKFDVTTLKTFDKVLVRHNKDNKWCASFFSHIDKDLHSNCYKFVTIAGKSYPMMIPYEENQHLLGTTNDCDEFYKIWE